MRRVLLSVAILFAFACALPAQPPPANPPTRTTDPTGKACAANSLLNYIPSGRLFTCDATGHYAAAGGGPGTGTVTSIATGCGLSGGTVTTTGTISQAILTAAHNGSYAILTGDCGKSLTTNTAAAWTIAQAGTTGFEAGKFWTLQNVGSGSLTVTATTSTFYGGPTAQISGSVLTVAANSGATIVSDGTNFQVISGGGTPAANVLKRSIGVIFQSSAALVSGITLYWTVPFSCTISAWNITATPADTATVDIWKIASGTAVPTIANTITAMALPAISTGTALHSTTLTGWATAAAANDIWAFNLQAAGGTATQVTISVECDQ